MPLMTLIHYFSLVLAIFTVIYGRYILRGDFYHVPYRRRLVLCCLTGMMAHIICLCTRGILLSVYLGLGVLFYVQVPLLGVWCLVLSHHLYLLASRGADCWILLSWLRLAILIASPIEP
jgi:uncharacterized membrane protein